MQTHPLYFLAAAAAAVVAAIGAAAQSVTAAVAEQEQQNDDPADVAATETVIIHTKNLQVGFAALAAHSNIFPSPKLCAIILNRNVIEYPLNKKAAGLAVSSFFD